MLSAGLYPFQVFEKVTAGRNHAGENIEELYQLEPTDSDP
jgi:hypothetical protein